MREYLVRIQLGDFQCTRIVRSITALDSGELADLVQAWYPTVVQIAILASNHKEGN